MLTDAVPASGGSAHVTRGLGGNAGWVRIFDGGLDAQDGDDFAAYRGFISGVVAGREGNGGRGVFGGIGALQYGSQENNAFETRAMSLFGGLYGSLWRGDYSLAMGIMRNDTNREVANNTLPTGLEVASAEYSSVFIAPSLTFDGILGGGGNSLRLRYLGVWHDAHSYDFSLGDLAVDARLSYLAEARMEFRSQVGGSLLRYGLDVAFQSGDEIGLNLEGAPFEVTSGAAGWSGRAFAGMEIGAGRYEIGYGSNGQLTASAALVLNF